MTKHSSTAKKQARALQAETGMPYTKALAKILASQAPVPDPAAVTAVTEAILADVGSQMSELYSAIPDLLCDHHPDWQALSPTQQDAWVKAVAVELGGEGYTP